MSNHTTALDAYRAALLTLAAAEAANLTASSKLTDAEIAASDADQEETKARNEVKRLRKELDAALVGVACDD